MSNAFVLSFYGMIAIALGFSCDETEDHCFTYLDIRYASTMNENQAGQVYAKNGKLYSQETNVPVQTDNVISADGWNLTRNLITANGTMPGPTIFIYQNQTITILVNNLLINETVTVHWHGIDQLAHPAMDGVAYLSQCPILPGHSFNYTFKPRFGGSYWYHSHVGIQRDMGLYGALLSYAKELLNKHLRIILFKYKNGTTLASLSQPSETNTSCNECDEEKTCKCSYSLNLKSGSEVIMVLSTLGQGATISHPIHMHGHTFEVLKMVFPEVTDDFKFVFTNDIKCSETLSNNQSQCNNARWRNASWNNYKNIPGINLNDPIRKDTIVVPYGGYIIIRINATNPGVWFLHCHIDKHMAEGMAVMLNESFEHQHIYIPKGFPTCHSYLKTPSGIINEVQEINGPCRTAQNIDDWQRSAAFGTDTTMICDNVLTEGWYRVISHAGELMPTECPRGGFRCNTAKPIYLYIDDLPAGDEAYPAVGVTVTRTAYASNYNGNSYPNVTVSPFVKTTLTETKAINKYNTSMVYSRATFECHANDLIDGYKYKTRWYINDIEMKDAVVEGLSKTDVEAGSGRMLEEHWTSTYKPNMLVKCALQVGGNGFGRYGPQHNSKMFFAGLKVYVKDSDIVTLGRSCYSHNDPHLRTFDQKNYELKIHQGLTEGEYIMYKHDRLPLQITLPTGTKVTFNYGPNYVDGINIIPSVLDTGMTKGLCGIYNGNSNDDFILRDQLTPVTDIKTFASSWQVKGAYADETLFDPNGKLKETVYNGQQYCTCVTPDDNYPHGSPEFNCELTAAMQQCRDTKNNNRRLYGCLFNSSCSEKEIDL
ncbi:unnamed protein product [Mytilus edulis]|uniref:Laccase n=1 Tax=Mytilus edulis TaxID=6550 RepID=A0A8S3SGL2_MYTED|nr:unnamed protein product [Mytilus edulis]